MSKSTVAPPVDYARNHPSSGRTILGHPSGLFVLFFAELWERFNFYGMRALLVFYMTKVLLFDDKFGLLSYGAYNALVYATPLLGGMLADRILGYRRAIVLGGILMALGEFGLAAGGLGILSGRTVGFYVPLSLIIVGNGFFKPNISTMVGTLYAPDDARRDSAFTIFYMGINVGATLAPLICGWIGESWGYHYGFMLAGLGMLIGLACFVLFGRHLGDRGLPPPTSANNHGRSRYSHLDGLTLLGAIVFVPIAAYLVQRPQLVAEYAAPVVGGVFLIYILWEALRSTRVERNGIFVALILMTMSIAFWAAFEQAGSSLNIFTDRHVNRSVFGIEIKASVFQATNAIFIVLLAPLFSWLWIGLDRRNMNPTSATKFALGLVQVGAGFLFMVWAARQAQGDGKAGLHLLLLCYLVHTMAELCVSPVGLSMITKMAPARLGGLLMGAWFLCTALAHAIAGIFASQVKDWGFEKLFYRIMIAGVCAGVFLLIIRPLVNHWEREKLAANAAE